MMDVVATRNDTFPRCSVPDLEHQSADSGIDHRPERDVCMLPRGWRRAVSPRGWTIGDWSDSF
jgi:hypothetical protein